MADDVPMPKSLRREGEGLRIDWADGTSTFATWRAIRAACPCASCQEDRNRPPDPFRVLKPSEVTAGPPSPAAMKPVGHYAYQIAWNDGHSTGIYTLAALRSLGSTAD
jgi:DUF971 family protein